TTRATNMSRTGIEAGHEHDAVRHVLRSSFPRKRESSVVHRTPLGPRIRGDDAFAFWATPGSCAGATGGVVKIHEYQGKEIFRRFGLPTPRGIPAFSVDEAVKAA